MGGSRHPETGSTIFDTVIIGGGPAGISAALWCSELGLSAVLLERSGQLGGQLHNIFNPIRNFPGREAENGEDFYREFVKCLQDRRVRIITNATIGRIDAGEKRTSLADGSSFRSTAIIIAAGVRRRDLGVRGEGEFRGRGVLESGAKDRRLVEGKRVVVVGGGDAAIENALIFSEFAEKVVVVHRRDRFTARSEFLAAAQN